MRENIKNISEKSEKPTNQINAIVLDRPRNQYIVDALIKLDVNIEMISDSGYETSWKWGEKCFENAVYECIQYKNSCENHR